MDLMNGSFRYSLYYRCSYSNTLVKKSVLVGKNSGAWRNAFAVITKPFHTRNNDNCNSQPELQLIVIHTHSSASGTSDSDAYVNNTKSVLS
jgi:hypothetical protein